MGKTIFSYIDCLIKYALKFELIEEYDKIYVRNRILDILHIDDYEDQSKESYEYRDVQEILDGILDWAYANGKLEENTVTYRDLLDTKIIGAIMPLPSSVIGKFNSLYKESPEKATDFFYNLSKNSNYIRMDRIKKNVVWKSKTAYGDMDITINLSKPEKDPKAIAAARNLKSSSYPRCLLCKENEGYAGRVNHPARQNHRIIPMVLKNEKWYMQYSPYVYYNEHSIIFKGEHEPMKISKETFDRLLEFTEILPHYFIGSNADLPIVGGSILSHDHFQGGNYEFAMAKSPVEKSYKVKEFENINIGIVKWPMSVIRLNGPCREEVSILGEIILNKWKKYSDGSVDILANSNGEPHNTVTPIARRRGEMFELDLVLRNNRTSEEYPLGIFHPHNEVHHIKKENIGLIEVMGLAVLPARLIDELDELKKCLLDQSLNIRAKEELEKHMDWYKEIKEKYDSINEENVDAILKEEVGKKFALVLEHAGVFKDTEEGRRAFEKFIKTLSDT